MPKCNGVVKEGAMHKNVAVKTDEKKRWRIEVLNKVTRHIRLDFHRNRVNKYYVLNMSFDRFLLAVESHDLSQANKSIIRVSSFPKLSDG